MLSESARTTTAAESRFRVQAPNSRPRRILVVALDLNTAGLGPLLARESWRSFDFADFRIAGRPQNPAFKNLAELEGQTYDQVILVGTAGSDLGPAREIADRYRASGVKISAVLLGTQDTGRAAISRALLVLRPLARTLALVRDEEFLRDLLLALGAEAGAGGCALG